MLEFKDYYKVLGVARDATADQIKKAYRKLARQYHPDVSSQADAADRMSQINEAYAALSDVERRAAYDALGQGRQQGERFSPSPDWEEGFEFSGAGVAGTEADQCSDFFSQLFGRSAGGPRGPQARGGSGANSGFAMRGEDHHARIVLDLQDALSGATRQVTLRSPRRDAQGRATLVERKLDVSIPMGIRAGQRIRLAGQGGAGSGNAPAGDLLLEVQFRPHPRFEIEGSDLIADLPVAPWEAALGGIVPVELPDGSRLKVRVPEGAQGGQRLTVRGKGLPGPNRGDLELIVQVVLPDARDPKIRALYETMARELPDFDARSAASPG